MYHRCDLESFLSLLDIGPPFIKIIASKLHKLYPVHKQLSTHCPFFLPCCTNHSSKQKIPQPPRVQLLGHRHLSQSYLLSQVRQMIALHRSLEWLKLWRMLVP